MIRILIVITACLLASLQALAAPSDARDWAALADDLLSQAVSFQQDAAAEAVLDASPPPPTLRMGLQRFGVASSRLSKEMARYEGAKDLACIFRGMAEETDLQLKSLLRAETGGDQADALARLVMMLDDAVHVGEAAARTMEASTKLSTDAEVVVGACEAAPFK